MLLYVEKVLSNPFAEYNFQNWTTLLGHTVSCTIYIMEGNLYIRKFLHCVESLVLTKVLIEDGNSEIGAQM